MEVAQGRGGMSEEKIWDAPVFMRRIQKCRPWGRPSHLSFFKKGVHGSRLKVRGWMELKEGRCEIGDGRWGKAEGWGLQAEDEG